MNDHDYLSPPMTQEERDEQDANLLLDEPNAPSAGPPGESDELP